MQLLSKKIFDSVVACEYLGIWAWCCSSVCGLDKLLMGPDSRGPLKCSTWLTWLAEEQASWMSFYLYLRQCGRNVQLIYITWWMLLARKLLCDLTLYSAQRTAEPNPSWTSSGHTHRAIFHGLILERNWWWSMHAIYISMVVSCWQQVCSFCACVCVCVLTTPRLSEGAVYLSVVGYLNGCWPYALSALCNYRRALAAHCSHQEFSTVFLFCSYWSCFQEEYFILRICHTTFWWRCMVGYVVRSSCAIWYGIIQQEPHHLCSDTCMQFICCASAAEYNIHYFRITSSIFPVLLLYGPTRILIPNLLLTPAFHLSLHSFIKFTVFMCGNEHLGNTRCPSAQMSMRHFTSSLHQVHPWLILLSRHCPATESAISRHDAVMVTKQTNKWNKQIKVVN